MGANVLNLRRPPWFVCLVYSLSSNIFYWVLFSLHGTPGDRTKLVLNLHSWKTIYVKIIALFLSSFPASRGLSRRGKMKREERDLCRLPTTFLSACARVSLTTSDVFVMCDTTWEPVWIWAGARAAVEFECAPKILASFKANFSFLTSLSSAEADVFGVKFILGVYGTVGLLGFGTFLFEEKAISGLVTSGQRLMGWFPC